ncbi:MAG TPA: 1,4-dihydroxy-2-naphthoate polyprenyltransferase [Actinomycetaceae bacterium]|nr:1,4-dihydroxy-2-naphthoate polyprenyltransferase [Actinomycetaceae bacterium]
MATVADWLEGARVRTLPASLSPVILGTFSAVALGAGSIPRALLAAGLALALQIGVNFANDYSDGVRGTDDVRSGPPRLTGGGKASPRTVKVAAFASFGVGALLGLVLVALTAEWWLLLVGAAAVVAAWYYTGGSRPYGYMGLGEFFVFVFFGLVATLGTTYTQALEVDAASWLGASGVGLIACALLMINNIRDISTDSVVGKNTLAVRLGDRRARRVYVLMLVIPVVLGVLAASRYPWALLTLVLLPGVAFLARPVLGGRAGRDLIPVLKHTGFFEIAFAVVLGLGLVL